MRGVSLGEGHLGTLDLERPVSASEDGFAQCRAVARNALMVRSLPIRLTRVPGEGLDSYLEALAYRSQTTWGDLLDAVGLADSAPMRPGGHRWVIRLTGPQLSAVSRSTGLDVSAVASMTLSSSMPAFDQALAPLLLSPPRSRFCPHCLTSDTAGRWQLWWRLRWSFACPRHRCLLADYCPGCGRPPRTGPLPLWLVPQPASCMRKGFGAFGRDLTRCGTALSAYRADRLPTGRVLSIQSRLLHYLGQESVVDGIYRDHPVTVPQFLADLAAVTTRILHYGQPGELRSRLPAYLGDLDDAYLDANARGHALSCSALCAASVQTAVGVLCAFDVLGAADLAAAGQRLRWLVDCSRARGQAVTASNIGWGKHVSHVLRAVQLTALEPYLGPSDQLRYRCGTALPDRGAPAAARHRHVPALLWAAAADGFTVRRIGSEQLRSALATAVLVAGTPTTLSRGTALLGSVATAASVSRVLQALRADEKWATMRAAIVVMADAIDGGDCPIDYAARRALPFESFLAADEWRSICRDTATPVGRGIKVRLIRSWMYQRLVGSPARCAPGAYTGRDYRDKLTQLIRSLTPELGDALDRYARAFLDVYGQRAEPLYWDIPEALLSDVGMPIAESMDVAELHQMVRNPGLTVTMIAEQLGVKRDTVLDILGSRPAPLAPRTWHQSRVRGAAFADAKAQISGPTLTDLYLRQGLGLAEIASRTGMSRQTVRKLAIEYGIEVRSPGRSRRS